MKRTRHHDQRLIKELCRHAQHFYSQGWMPGTSGNLSVKLGNRPITMAITPTSVDKGELTPNDILIVGPGGKIL